jgi:hypothetical protein
MADVDYEALAKQFGGTTTAPSAATAGNVDYESLAKQFGGVTAAPKLTEGMPVGRQADNSAAQWLGVANRALAPYATAAGVGAAAGAPFMGVGAIPGAAMGVTALGLGDLGTSAYNLGAGYFGGKRVPLPSETIQNAYNAFGIGHEPQTTGQQILSSGLSGAAGGFVPAKALNTLAPLIRSPVGREIVNELAAQPVGQAAVGAGAAMAPEMLQSAGIEDPRLLALSSAAGGLAGAKGTEILGRSGQTMANTVRRGIDVATGQPTASVDALKTAADTAYKAADAAGVTFSPQSYGALVDDINAKLKSEGFVPKLNPTIAKAVNVLDDYRDQPQSLTQLKELRKGLSDLKASPEPNVRRLAGDIVSRIDKYVEQPPANAIISGDPAGIAALNEGRSMWARMRKSETVENILKNVDLSKSDAADAIQSQFASLAKNDRRMMGFSDAERAAIRQIGEGKATPTTLNIISKIAPGVDLKGLMVSAALAGGAYHEGMTPEEAAMLGVVGLGAKGARNYLAKRNVSNLAAGIRRGDVQLPYTVRPNSLALPMAQPILNNLAGQ